MAKMATNDSDVPEADNLAPAEGVPASIEWLKKHNWGGYASKPGDLGKFGYQANSEEIVMLGREGGRVVVSTVARSAVEPHLKKMGFNVDNVVKNQGGYYAPGI
jgi:hypothetical protein